ncbi:MAG: undecaprenyl-diphosphatase UppP [Candidatus Levybacteria bacterium RBG_16_35_11]|nr:MAG: undecaprenyl-diphosphatase UppP [Candidatus Levybacteria bacterium RBG_16_35_11]
MNLLYSFILGIVEGFTEFLPISSTGHLILTADILKIVQSNFVKDFEIIIQLGAILAIVVLYFKTFIKNKKVWLRIISAFIPTAVIGFLLFKVVKDVFLGNTYITLWALLIGGILLILLELIHKEKGSHVENIESISIRNSFLIGVFQSFSIIPGVSRAAATIIGALFLGTKRKTAVEFSFLLAVPTMIAASALDIAKGSFSSYPSSELAILAVGFLTSFIVAILAVKFFLNFIKKHTFIPFGIYRIILAILFWLIILK